MLTPGHPPHEPTELTRAQVTALVSFGIPQMSIARQIGISDETLRKHYSSELEHGVHDANSKVAGVLFKKAVDQEDLTACIFWLKTRARWSDKGSDDEYKKAMSIVEQILALKK